tara:strand:+ start:472 stop:921 length:450 start_codon:yes stop_codon:yes gene_type:complete
MEILNVKILDPRISNYLPSYSTEGSAGLDLRSSLEETVLLKPGDTKLIPSGIAVYINDKKFAGLILPRSGLGHKKGIVLGNLVGLIDSDYQGELMISIWNRSESEYEIHPMDRIAQLVIVSISQVKLNVTKQFSKTNRATSGFGSTGKD